MTDHQNKTDCLGRCRLRIRNVGRKSFESAEKDSFRRIETRRWVHSKISARARLYPERIAMGDIDSHSSSDDIVRLFVYMCLRVIYAQSNDKYAHTTRRPGIHCSYRKLRQCRWNGRCGSRTGPENPTCSTYRIFCSSSFRVCSLTILHVQSIFLTPGFFSLSRMLSVRNQNGARDRPNLSSPSL
jgi:hypothetical protein